MSEFWIMVTAASITGICNGVGMVLAVWIITSEPTDF